MSAELELVFVNLLSNAVQAFDTANRTANLIRVRTRTDEAGLVVVEVADTGRGMSREFISRVFEPYYSAGNVGATPGLGLGLSLCHGIVTRLGGQISVDSEPGKGTMVRLRFLPAIGAQRRAGPPSRAASRARILVIDDEEVLLRALERWLS